MHIWWCVLASGTTNYTGLNRGEVQCTVNYSLVNRQLHFTTGIRCRDHLVSGEVAQYNYTAKMQWCILQAYKLLNKVSLSGHYKQHTLTKQKLSQDVFKADVTYCPKTEGQMLHLLLQYTLELAREAARKKVIKLSEIHLALSQSRGWGIFAILAIFIFKTMKKIDT